MLLAFTPGIDTMYDVRPFVIGVSVATVAIFVLFAAIKNYNVWRRTNTGKEYTVRAEVVRKTVDLKDEGQNYRGTRSEYVTNAPLFKAEFRLLRKNEKIVLLVNNSEYDVMSEGSRGILKYHNNICISFSIDKDK